MVSSFQTAVSASFRSAYLVVKVPAVGVLPDFCCNTGTAEMQATSVARRRRAALAFLTAPYYSPAGQGCYGFSFSLLGVF